MGTPVEGTENADAKKENAQVEEAVAEIEKQEAKVENASSPAEEKKEQDKLDKLIEGFDTMLARLGNVEKRLEEPTVPAPPAKQEATAQSTTESESSQATTDESSAKPRKRRLGAWGA